MTRTLFGFSEEELLGRPFLEFIHPEDRGMVAERYQRRIKGDTSPSVYQFRILHKDCGFRWVEINVVAFMWEKSPATLNFFKDITARKIAEMKLQESEERFRTLIESAPMAIAISRATRFTYVNQKFLQMFGYEKMEDLIGKPISDMVIEEDAATFMERARKREEGADVDTRYNITGRHRNGTRFPVTAAVARADFPDGPATIGFFQDNSGS
jgi:PAS domain S-box-containing protein